MSLRFGDLVREAQAALQNADVPNPQKEARILAALAAGIPADRASLSFEEPVAALAKDQLTEHIAARVARVPMSHLTGLRAFYRHEFVVSADVLDPRPDTETLVDAALEHAFGYVLDLGTGSGCILLSLLAARPEASGVGTDISPSALEVAHRNAADLGLAKRCLLVQSDWFDALEGQFDLIVANPPYISADEMNTLEPELAHEPRGALTDEGDGLTAYRQIIAGAGDHLHEGGKLMLEIGWQQGPQVSALFETAGFETVSILQDLNGKDRVVTAIWPGK